MDGTYILGFGQSVEFRMVSLGICEGVLPIVMKYVVQGMVYSGFLSAILCTTI